MNKRFAALSIALVLILGLFPGCSSASSSTDGGGIGMSISIDFKSIVKKYGNNTVIPNLSLNIKEGDFFTLLGPSGCGKTTLLRMVPGFNSIEVGEYILMTK